MAHRNKQNTHTQIIHMTVIEKVLIFSVSFVLFVTTRMSAAQDKMRDFVTDRPDKTESPYTVPAGHFQFETDFLSYTYNQQIESGQTTTTRKFFANQINLKVGVNNKVDFQTVIQSLVFNETDIDGAKEIKKGFGDTTLRVKINLMGNDEGDIAVGLLPFLKIPTAASNLGNGKFEGGVIFPLMVALPQQWQLGTMVQLNQNKNESNSDFHSVFISSFSLGHSIIQLLSGYIEFYSESSSERNSKWIATLDMGLTYNLTPNTQLDAGINIGLTSGADVINPFAGLSMRF